MRNATTSGWLECLGRAALGVFVCAWLAQWPNPAEIAVAADTAGVTSIQFSDISAQTGIVFKHTDGSDGRHFLIESMSAGLALLDYDNDGDLDIYFLNGAGIADAQAPKSFNALYRNDGNLKFTEVTFQAHVGDSGYGLGVACADYNNDGFVDIYVNNYGANVLYENNADGTFTDVSVQAGVVNGSEVGGGASFFDMDMDGNLDLYVANYMQFSPENHRVHIHKGLPSYPSPLSFQPAADSCFRSLGDGTFADVSLASGLRNVAGRSMAVATFDCDGDGDIDIFVANDSQENHLFSNDGRGNFEEVGLLSGVSHDFRGRAQGSMGVEVADLDLDGLQDLVVTSFAEEFVCIYRNAGQGLFEDRTIQSRIGPATLPHVTWGVVAEDFDADGFTDLFIGAGDLDDNRSQRGGAVNATAYRVPDLMFRSDRGQAFEFLGERWGTAALARTSTRGVVAGDLDGDGDIDLVTLNARDRPAVFRNDSSRPAAAWPAVPVKLVGNRSNRDCLGARVRYLQAGRQHEMVVHSGRSYQSDMRGPLLIPAETFQNAAESQPLLEVTWPGASDWQPIFVGARSPSGAAAVTGLVIVQPD